MTSQWFECPCHGSQYNRVGEKKGGPAPRGLDRFAIDGRRRRRSPSTPAPIIQGPPIGTNTTGQEAEGPHCVGGGALMMLTRCSTVLAASTVKRSASSSPSITGHRLRRLRRRQHPRRPGRGRLRDRAGAQPQALLRRRGARGPASSTARCAAALVLLVDRRRRPAALLAQRAGPAGRAPSRTSSRPFVNRGAELFAPTGEGGYNCAGCHGAEGVGGQAPVHAHRRRRRVRRHRSTGRRRRSTPCCSATAEEEVRVHPHLRPARHARCRRGAPRAAARSPTQQIDDLIAYLESIQLTPRRPRPQVEAALRDGARARRGATRRSTASDPRRRRGALQPRPRDGVAGGAYSCARCHTKGCVVSSTAPSSPPTPTSSDYAGFPDGIGRLRPRSPAASSRASSSTSTTSIEFVRDGHRVRRCSTASSGQGTGRMPGFGDNPNTDDAASDGDVQRRDARGHRPVRGAASATCRPTAPASPPTRRHDDHDTEEP